MDIGSQIKLFEQAKRAYSQEYQSEDEREMGVPIKGTDKALTKWKEDIAGEMRAYRDEERACPEYEGERCCPNWPPETRTRVKLLRRMFPTPGALNSFTAAAGDLGWKEKAERAEKLARQAAEKHARALTTYRRIKREILEQQNKEIDDYADAMVADHNQEGKESALGELLGGKGEIFEALGSITEQDLPLRLFFLDKSGSMAFDKTCYTALHLATYNALHPQSGSSLVVFCGAPAETQMVFARASEHKNVDVQLGTSTWVNEPVLLVLRAMLPLLTSGNLLDLQLGDYYRTNDEPGIQVVAVTDGLDNESAVWVDELPNLIDAISALGSDEGSGAVYTVVAGQAAEVPAGLCPVWMLWVALSDGGRPLLEQASAQACIVDAHCPPDLGDCEPALGLEYQDDAEKLDTAEVEGTVDDLSTAVAGGVLKPGACILVGKGKIQKEAVVVEQSHGGQVAFMMQSAKDCSETTTSTVDVVPEPAWEAAKTDATVSSPLRTLNLVLVATTNPAELCNNAEAGIAKELRAAARLDEAALRVKCIEAHQGTQCAQLELNPLPSGFIKKLVRAVGAACSELKADDERVESQMLVVEVTEKLVRGGLVRLEEVLESTLCKRNKKVAKAAEAVLELLLSCGALRQHAKFNGCSRPSCPCGSSQKAGFAAQE